VSCLYGNAALSASVNAKPRNLCCIVGELPRSGSHGPQPPIANPGLGSDGARRRLFWNLVVPRWIHSSRLPLDSRICVACTAIHGVACSSIQGSVGFHTSLNFERATSAPIGDMPPWRCGLRGGSLSLAVVARTMAGWSCFRSFRLAGVGSSNRKGNSISPKSVAATSLTPELYLVSYVTDKLDTGPHFSDCASYRGFGDKGMRLGFHC
jgi:hypothetical protein